MSEIVGLYAQNESRPETGDSGDPVGGRGDDLGVAKGILLMLLLSIPVWIVIGGIVCWLL